MLRSASASFAKSFAISFSSILELFVLCSRLPGALSGRQTGIVTKQRLFDITVKFYVRKSLNKIFSYCMFTFMGAFDSFFTWTRSGLISTTVPPFMCLSCGPVCLPICIFSDLESLKLCSSE